MTCSQKGIILCEDVSIISIPTDENSLILSEEKNRNVSFTFLHL